MHRVPYIRYLENTHTLMVPTPCGMVAASAAVAFRLPVDGIVYRSVSAIRQAYISTELEL